MYRVDDPCSVHTFAPAVGKCGDCGAKVCDGCEVFVGMARRCVACARRFRARRVRVDGFVRVAVLLAALAASLSTGIVLGMAADEPEPPPAVLFKF